MGGGILDEPFFLTRLEFNGVARTVTEPTVDWTLMLEVSDGSFCLWCSSDFSPAEWEGASACESSAIEYSVA